MDQPPPLSPDFSFWVWAGGVVAAGIAGFVGYLRFQMGLNKQEARSKHVVLEKASIADMQPIREVGHNVREMRDAVLELTKVIKEWIAEQEADDEVSERAEVLAERRLRIMLEDEQRRRRDNRPPTRPRTSKD